VAIYIILNHLDLTVPNGPILTRGLIAYPPSRAGRARMI
jgi:hypothetical protein